MKVIPESVLQDWRDILANKATPGTWERRCEEGEERGIFKYSVCREDTPGNDHACVATTYGRTEEESAWNAVVVAGLHSDMPVLIDEVLRLREVLEVAGMVSDHEGDFLDGDGCIEALRGVLRKHGFRE